MKCFDNLVPAFRLVAPLVLSFSLATAACGDDQGPGAPDATPRIDAPPPPDAMPGTCTCVAIGADYTANAGSVTQLSLPSLTVTKNVVPAAAGGDGVVRIFGTPPTVYLLNRLGFDNVTVIDPSTWQVKQQFSTGSGSNPQDIAVSGTTGWVVALGKPEVQEWDLANPGAAPAHTIDLEPYVLTAEMADMNPDAVSIVLAGTDAYVTLGHLNMFAPVGKGTVVVIDTTTRMVKTTFDLTYSNPVNFTRARASKGDLLVSTVGDFSATTGCLERITPGTTPANAGCLVESIALGGNIAGFVPADDGFSYVLAESADFKTSKLMKVADGSGAATDTMLVKTGELPTDVAYCGATHQLVTNDGTAGGLRVYDLVGGHEVTTTALDIGQPPAFANGLTCY